MKKLFTLTLLLTLVLSMNLDGTAQSLKTVLAEQLKTTHNKKEWFVPVNVALAGLTAEQAIPFYYGWFSTAPPIQFSMIVPCHRDSSRAPM